MKATFHSGVHKFALFVVGWAVLLLCAGALVTSEDAALAVPDWPLSYGSITPPLGGLTVLKLLHYWLPVMHACLAQIMFATLVSIAVVTSRWWVSERPQYEDKATPAIHTVVVLNAAAIFLQIALGAAFRHKYSPVTPHVVWAMGVLLVASWTAVQLRKRFSNSPEITRIRALLHGIVGVQVLLGIGALWTRLQSANDPQPLAPVIITTVVHTVFGAVLFATSILAV